jgi:hypothetical protein
MAQTDHGLVMLLSQPELDDGAFLRLWEAFHNRVLRGGVLPVAVQWNAAELTLHSPPQAITFTDVRCTAEPFASGTKARIDFRVAGVEMASPAQLAIVRDRAPHPPVTKWQVRTGATPLTKWQVRTGATPLPCSLFADYCPPLARLGSECRFQGSVWAEESGDSWDGEIAGRFQQVDLQQLLAPFPHKLSGAAEVTLTHARFRSGRLTGAAGSLHAHGGVVSTSLLSTIGEALQLRVTCAGEESSQPLHTYEQLALGFQLDAAGLRVAGLCTDATPGAVLVGRSGTILADSTAEVVPAVALAQALSPDHHLHVPATRETDLLLRALPLPEASSTIERTANRESYAPLRLKK